MSKLKLVKFLILFITIFCVVGLKNVPVEARTNYSSSSDEKSIYCNVLQDSVNTYDLTCKFDAKIKIFFSTSGTTGLGVTVDILNADNLVVYTQFMSSYSTANIELPKGTYTIRLANKYGDFKAVMRFNFTYKLSEDFPSLTLEDAILNVGETKKLLYTCNPSSSAMTWLSSNPNVAIVNSEGYVTALETGTCIITLYVGGAYVYCEVTVNPIEINNTNYKIYVKESRVLSVTGTVEQVKWSSSNKKVVSVSASGRIHAIKSGNAIITGTVSGKNLKCKVTVLKDLYKINKVNYSWEKVYAAYGLASLDAMLKDPSSLKINNIYYGKTSSLIDAPRKVIIDYSASNSLGGSVRNYMEITAGERLSYYLENSWSIDTDEIGCLNCYDSSKLIKPIERKKIKASDIVALRDIILENDTFTLYN